MNSRMRKSVLSAGLLLGSAHAAFASEPSPSAALLEGTWTLEAADALLPDGRRVPDFGSAPVGRLIVDSTGRYSLQIFSTERPAFAAGNKTEGTEAEFRSAVLGSSTHYGRIVADTDAMTLTFEIEGASFPNWQNTRQVRSFELSGGRLSYRVPPRPDGGIPISIWRRLP